MKYDPTEDSTQRHGERHRRARVLVSAFSFSPVGGSEPAVGWHIASRLAQWHDVTVLCSPGIANQNRRAVIEDHLARKPVAGLTVHFVEPPVLTRLFQADGRRDSVLRGLYYVGYAAWQRAAYRQAIELHRQQRFDLVHHLTFTGYREPGYLWKLPVPFVWGPVGGVPEIPISYFPLLGARDQLIYGAKELMNEAQKRVALRSRRAALAARQVWVNSEPARQMFERWGRHAMLVPETGSSPQPQAAVRSYHSGGPLKLVWSGVHIGVKAMPIVLHAMKRAKDAGVEVSLTVVGRGTATASWVELAERLGVGSQVRWTGALPHDQALTEMARADVLAFSSLQEGTPHVVIEALSLGLPVICHDCCGMRVVVTDKCGIKLKMTDPQTSIGGFADAMLKLAGTPGLVESLSRGALARSGELTWDRHAAVISSGYDRILSEGAAADGLGESPGFLRKDQCGTSLAPS
ncbi:MAG: glycosyltransferase family 4 protein [Gemmatimonadaceae bacterium]|nr:glycosyltransferase family 4 protein [Gemmatimonadaceae bacterium]